MKYLLTPWYAPSMRTTAVFLIPIIEEIVEVIGLALQGRDTGHSRVARRGHPAGCRRPHRRALHAHRRATARAQAPSAAACAASGARAELKQLVVVEGGELRNRRVDAPDAVLLFRCAHLLAASKKRVVSPIGNTTEKASETHFEHTVPLPFGPGPHFSTHLPSSSRPGIPHSPQMRFPSAFSRTVAVAVVTTFAVALGRSFVGILTIAALPFAEVGGETEEAVGFVSGSGVDGIDGSGLECAMLGSGDAG